MSGLKICIIGAGSSYTPEIIEGLAECSLPISQIALFDINSDRLKVMYDFSLRYAKHLGFHAAITATSDRAEALAGADFINIQIRIGGNEARSRDEKIPLKYGLVGQETTGAGGFMKALRTIPVMLDIAKDVEQYCPNAWMINYTNPTGIVAEAVNRYSGVKIAGLCSGGFFPKEGVARVFNVDPASIRYDYFGLNHMNFAYNITINGEKLTDEQFEVYCEKNTKMDAELLKALKLIPSPYVKWYFNTGSMIEKLKSDPLTRGEKVKAIEAEVFAAIKEPACVTKPEALKKRGGGGYSEIALGVMEAIYYNKDRWMIINVPNNGTIKCLPDQAVIETGCMVNRAGIKPVNLKEIPQAVWGLVCAVKNYEQLTVQAAVSGNITDARLALLAHPLVRDYDVIVPMLDEMLEVNHPYLPQFYR